MYAITDRVYGVGQLDSILAAAGDYGGEMGIAASTADIAASAASAGSSIFSNIGSIIGNIGISAAKSAVDMGIKSLFSGGGGGSGGGSQIYNVVPNPVNAVGSTNNTSNVPGTNNQDLGLAYLASLEAKNKPAIDQNTIILGAMALVLAVVVLKK